ncbi:MAG: hypothetical protein IKD74_00305 [Clostridia bacterium]|nr:hypothetical protein [Clostridia bacterium]
MKKKMILTAILVMVIGICTFNTVNAAYEVQSEKLPIKTIINLVDDDSEEKENVVLENETFNYVLTPLTEGAPLPAGSQDGRWNISVKGDYRDYFIDSIKFIRPGIYEYKFEQIPGTNEDIQYDNMVYKLIYDVSNNETYDSLVCKVIITDEEENYKYEDVLYTNLYTSSEVPVDPDPHEDPEPKPEPVPEEKIDTSDINVLLYVAIFVGSAYVITRKIKSKKEN